MGTGKIRENESRPGASTTLHRDRPSIAVAAAKFIVAATTILARCNTVTRRAACLLIYGTTAADTYTRACEERDCDTSWNRARKIYYADDGARSGIDPARL